MNRVGKMTPMLIQYFELKSQCPEAVLFFRMGDFYEVFGDDAERIAPILNIVLTSREKGDQSKINFCGVPHHSARSYWLKLLKKNFKIAVADQIGDTNAKGLVHREITRRLSPGCIDDLQALDADAPNYISAIYEEPSVKRWALCLADISTGELRVGELPSFEAALKSLEVFAPKELLCRRFFADEFKEAKSKFPGLATVLVGNLPESPLRDPRADCEVVKRLSTSTPGVDILKTVSGGKELLFSLFSYLKNLKVGLNAFRTLKPLKDPDNFQLPHNVVRDLEIFVTNTRKERKGSLFSEINSSLTPMGSRLLRWNLSNPSRNKSTITRRHDFVEQILEIGEQRLDDLRTSLRGFADLERLLAKTASKSICPPEFAILRSCCEQSERLEQNLAQLPPLKKASVFDPGDLAGIKGLASKLARTFADEISPLGAGEVFRRGFDAEFDRLVELARDSQQRIDAYQEGLRQKVNISSLKIKNHKSYGLLIEVTKTHMAKVPNSFVLRQTMVNCNRYTTVELQELAESIFSAKEQLVERERFLFQQFVVDILPDTKAAFATAEAIANFDMLLGFAHLASRKNYVRAHVDKSIALIKARHPSIEGAIGRHKFVANDICLSDQEKMMLITGPNMGGKSTAMRMVAVCAILNQCGAFVPAESAKLPIFDRVMTRVGACDDLSRGLSTFMVEMTETAQILSQATSNSLVILDEVGRGTSTEDGLAIASAVLENLVGKVCCWGFFATHYHELIPSAKLLAGVRLCQTGVIKNAKEIIFTHRLLDGYTTSSYGIDVATLAGIPSSVIERARDKLQERSRQKQSSCELEHAPAKPVDIELEESTSRCRESVRSQAAAFLHDGG